MEASDVRASTFGVALRAWRTALLTVLLASAALGLGGDGACLVDDGTGQALAWGDATCVIWVASLDGETRREYQVTFPSEERTYRLVATVPAGVAVDVCLRVGGTRSCRRGEGSVALPALVLPAGSHPVHVRAPLPAGSSLRLALEDEGPVRPGFEREPNDTVATATPVLGPDFEIRGRLSGREEDFCRVDVASPPRYWRAVVDGAGVRVLRFHDASGRVLQARQVERDESVIRLTNLYLVPGPHWFSLDGADADYVFRLVPWDPTELASGTRPPGLLEREPNDDASRAHRLRPDEPWVGLLAEPRDVDAYRFTLGAASYVRITVVPPADGAVEADASGSFSAAAVGEPYVYEAWFLAGDHVVRLRPAVVSEGFYQIVLELLDPFTLPDDLEPNDQPYQAAPLAPDFVARGHVGTHRDSDWFRLPILPAETDVTIVLEGDDAGLGAIRDAAGAVAAHATFDRDAGVYRAALPAGGPYGLEVRGVGDYHLRLAFGPGGPASTPRPVAPDVDVRIVGEHDVAAYHHLAQRLAFELELGNRTAEPIELRFASHVSDPGWLPTLPSAPFVLHPGRTERLPFEVIVLPPARDDQAVVLTVAAVAADGGHATASTRLIARCGALPIAPHRHWPVPEALLGGLNIAWSGLGAEPLVSTARQRALFSGIAPPGGGWGAALGDSLTVRLAGDAPSLVAGVGLHPAAVGPTGAALAGFRFSTSLDGVTFDAVLEGRLASSPAAQYLPLDEAVEARYARLEALSRQDGNPSGGIQLGQVEVIAVPASGAVEGPIDLALRELGGHVAVARPYLGTYDQAEAGRGPTSRRLDAGESAIWWVLGFHHGRMALIDALVWHDHVLANPERAIEAVLVSVSEAGPLGPWTEIGAWHPGTDTEWRFREPVWARYLRFDAEGFEPRAVLEYPDRITVLEHPEGPGYRSVLGAWGGDGREAAAEWLRRDAAPPTEALQPLHDGRASAALLVPGEMRESRVQVGVHEAWFALDVPPERNHVRLDLRGDPTVGYAFELVDEAGSPLALAVQTSPEGVVIEGVVEPGRVYLRTFEPPRSVVFAWDNSGSMGPFVDVTYQTLNVFAQGVDPDTERVQLLPFANTPAFLLDDWTGDPATLLAGLLAYDRRDGSSDAEGNLTYVVERLAERTGTRAIMLVTDAESGFGARNVTRLWQAFEAAPPVVFAFETSSAGSDHTQDRMQSWASVGGGFYLKARTMTDLDAGFARASCLVRRPKVVRVVAQFSEPVVPGPGALVVRRGADRAPEAPSGPPALLVVFDASGSMGKLLPDGSSTRLDAARAVLLDLVENVLEDDVHFALRAYGHVRPAACDTRLELRLALLDRAAAARAVLGIEPKLMSGTPLAASIEAAAQDLARAEGPRTVVVLTDGEETCDGDPEAAIRALRAAGTDVRVSIVGFDVDAVDEAVARDRFAAWATLGGGRYVEARDRDALAAAIVASLEPVAEPTELAFEVLAADGTVVARGSVDGDAVVLPAGDYSVRLVGPDQRTIESVHVAPESVTEIVLD